MPKSKRAKVVHLTKVDKKGKEHREAQFAKIQECLDEYKHCFVFRVENMRGNFLQQIRGELEDCKYVSPYPQASQR
jgi:mRNA turnover protein 4